MPPTCVLVNVLSSNEAGTIRRFIVDHSTEIAGPVVPVGYPVDDKEILILDDDGREVGGGQVGEIAVRSRFLSPGYWKRPELTDSVFVTHPVKTGERIIALETWGASCPTDVCCTKDGRTPGPRFEVFESRPKRSKRRCTRIPPFRTPLW